MFFENNDYFNLITNYSNINNQNELSEGFLRGNMFDNEFTTYNNMSYVMPEVKNDKERLLFNIMECNFKVIDYNLYLDVNPNDMEILNKYNKAT